jgi:hypothetical protein
MTLGQMDHAFTKLIDHRQKARKLYFELRLRDRRGFSPNAPNAQTDEAEKLWLRADANLKSYVDLHREYRSAASLA